MLCSCRFAIRNSLFSDLLLARSRSLSSRTISFANTRECSFGFLFVLSRRTAPCRASGNDVSSPRPVSRPFFFPLYLPFLPFGAPALPSSLLSLFSPLPTSLFLSLLRLCRPRVCRQHAENLPTYLPNFSRRLFHTRLDIVPRPVRKTSWRYLLPAVVAEKETQYFMETDRYWGVHYRYYPALYESISRGRGKDTTGMTIADKG